MSSNKALGVSPGAAIAAHSGLVVATAQPDSSFVGPVAMTARALSLVAPADSVFFSKAARVGAEGWFHFTDLPPVALPGLAAPLGGSRLDGPTDARNRWDVQARRSLSPFQGRTMERAMLDDLLERHLARAAAPSFAASNFLAARANNRIERAICPISSLRRKPGIGTVRLPFDNSSPLAVRRFSVPDISVMIEREVAKISASAIVTLPAKPTRSHQLTAEDR